MAHNSRIRLSGMWLAGTVLDPAEMEAVDEAQYHEIHELGGVWSIEADVTIGGVAGALWRHTGEFQADDADVTITEGKGLRINGLATLTVLNQGTVNLNNGSATHLAGLLHITSAGDVVADGGSTITTQGDVILASGSKLTAQANSEIEVSDTLTIKGGAHLTCNDNSVVALNGDTSFGSTATVVGHASATVTLHGTTTLDGTQAITGTTTLDGTAHVDAACTWRDGSSLTAVATAPFTLQNVVTCTNQLVVDGGFFLNGNATQDAGSTYTRHGNMTLDGDDATTSPRFGFAPNTDNTFDPSTKDEWEIPVLTANTTYNLLNPAKPGVYRFSQILHVDAANTLTIRRNSDSAVLKVFAANKQTWIDVKWDGSTMSVGAFGGT